MAAARHAARVTGCVGCHSIALSALLDLAGLAVRQTACRPVSIAPRNPSFGGLRRFSGSALKRIETAQSTSAATQQDSIAEEQEYDAEFVQYNAIQQPEQRQYDESEEQPSSVPWYLQDQGPGKEPLSKSTREKIPDLPPDPPENLQVILEHLSSTIGLDYLTLMDMRKLDPPPPLGANLIMLLGTARSEKHLHVAADRFCRWLRSTYKLAPDADGLIGKNELKKKLRRKARKAKLLRSAHAPPPADPDDGTSTTWICVNAGFIEKEVVEEHSLDSEGTIGFGTRIKGTRLVVQMFTEDKREQLDLETLWNGYVKRQARREAEIADKVGDELGLGGSTLHEVRSTRDYFRQSLADTSSSTRFQPQTQSLVASRQTRSYHSSTRRTLEPSTADKVPAFPLEMERVSNSIDPLQPVARNQTPTQPECPEPIRLLCGLNELRSKEVRTHLGKGASDRGSTEFLAAFFASVPPSESESYWCLRLKLIRKGLMAQHEGYGTGAIIDLLEEIAQSETHMQAVASQRIIDRIVRNVLVRIVTGKETSLSPHLYRLVKVLQNKLLHFTLTNSWTIGWLFLALITTRLLESETYAIRPDAIWHMTCVSEQVGLHQSQEIKSGIHVGVLEGLAIIGDWTAYWRYWNGIARRAERRPAFLYAAMFRHIASRQNARKCFEALIEWIPAMSTEEPPVRIVSELADSVKACVELADPDVLEQVRLGTNDGGQWVKLWRHCVAARQELADDGETTPDKLMYRLERIRARFMAYKEQTRIAPGSGEPTLSPSSPEEELDDI
ncbi:MAG: hypothetical protein LQ340_007840 [Diploschistes diacapsis]|nr:MAG: hypothetical protein LQ340_007840 [Diploschistes diacapsis]